MEIKKQPKNERVSVFELVVNSNKNEWSTNESNLRQRMDTAREVMFLGQHPLVIVLGLEDWTQEDRTRKDNVIEAEVSAGTLEYGEEKARLHFHAIVRVRHRGYFRLNQPKLKAAFERVYGGKIAVFSVRGRADTTEEGKIYIGKQGKTESVVWRPTKGNRAGEAVPK